MECGRVNGAVIYGAFQVQFGGKEDGIDVTFRKFTQLVLTL